MRDFIGLPLLLVGVVILVIAEKLLPEVSGCEKLWWDFY